MEPELVIIGVMGLGVAIYALCSLWMRSRLKETATAEVASTEAGILYAYWREARVHNWSRLPAITALIAAPAVIATLILGFLILIPVLHHLVDELRNWHFP